MGTNLPSYFSIQFLEQLLKFLVNFTLLKYVKSQRSYGFLITRADFWLPNFGFKRSLLSLLKRQFFRIVTYVFDNSNLSQEMFAIDTWGAVICSLGHGRKHMLTILPTIWRPGLSVKDFRLEYFCFLLSCISKIIYPCSVIILP